MQPTMVLDPFQSSHIAEAAAVKAVKSVKLNATSTMAIKDIHLLMQEQGLVAAYTVSITNNGTKSLDLLDYFIRVRGKSGKVFTGKASTESKEETRVTPNTTKDLTYYVIVDKGTKVKDLVFDVIKWDFSAPNYERRIGSINYSSSSVLVAPVFKAQTVQFNGNKIKGALKQFYVTQDSNAAYVTLSFLLENVGYSSTDLSKLKFALQSSSYSVYDVDASSLANQTIQPGQRKIVNLTAEVPLALLGKNLTLHTYTLDETNKVNLANGAFSMPVLKASSAVGADKSRAIFMDGRSVKTSAGTVYVDASETQSNVTLDYSLTNADSTSIAMPSLEFALRTKEGKEYPLTYTKEEGAKLLPGIEKTISLTGQIAAKVDPKTSKLVVRQAATESTKSYVIGTYLLSASTQVGTVGGAYTHDKTYEIKMASVQRSPQKDNDLLVAELQIKNISPSSKATPNLSGYFMINGVKVNSDAKVVKLDDTISIASNGTYSLVVYSEIPYTASFDDITFVLTTPIDDKSSKTLYQFKSQTVSTIPLYRANQTYEIKSVGRRTSVDVVKSSVYTSNTSKYFYAEFAAVNKESRAAVIGNIGAYIEDSQGVVIPVEVSKVKEKVLPDGRVLLSAWGQLNRNFDSTNYKLVVGQAITETTPTGTGTDSAAAETGTVIVKPVAYKLNTETKVKTDFKNLEIGGYNLSLRNLYNTLSVEGSSVDGVKLDFDYELTKSGEYDYIATKHKIMFEFVDHGFNKSTYRTTYDLVSASEGSSQFLSEGSNLHTTVTFKDTAILEKINEYKDYTINVYDVINDAKILIASKQLTWYEKDQS